MGEVQVLGGRYRLHERLGGGGMSVVWRAYDEVLNRYVAVKVLAGEHPSGAWPWEQIRVEAQAAAGLSHPHVTAVHDYGESVDDFGESVPFVVMELLNGETLARRMKSGPVPVRDILRITAEVATALSAAHAQGLVHCDIKPTNIVLTPAGAKVLDFGIAAAAGGRTAGDGPVFGTPAYVAPERLTGGAMTPAVDVYALGLVLYRLLAGAPPWTARSVADQLDAHVSEPPAPLPDTAGVPAEVAAVCLRCLAKDPGERPTAHEVATVLAAAGGWRVTTAPSGGDILAVPPLAGRVRRRIRAAGVSRVGRRRTVRGATATVVIVTAGVLAGWGVSQPASDQRPPNWFEGAPPVSEGDQPGDPGLASVSPEPDEASGDLPASTGTEGGVGTDGAGTGEVGAGGGSGSDLSAGSGNGSSGGGTGQDSGGEDSGDDPGTEVPPPAQEPEPEPEPEPDDPAPAPVEQVETLVTTGGTIVVRCVDSTASIVSVSPLAGFGIGEIDRGPGAEVGVTLDALLLSVGVTVRCDSGVPDASIEIG